VEALRAEVLRQPYRFVIRVGEDHPAVEDQLRIRADVPNPGLGRLLVEYERSEVLARRCICIIEPLVERIDADLAGHDHDIAGLSVHVPLALGVPADDDARIALACREPQVGIRLQIIPRDGEAYDVGRDHAPVVLGMLPEVVLEHQG